LFYYAEKNPLVQPTLSQLFNSFEEIISEKLIITQVAMVDWFATIVIIQATVHDKERI